MQLSVLRCRERNPLLYAFLLLFTSASLAAPAPLCGAAHSKAVDGIEDAKSGFAPVDGGKLYYEEAGSGFPVVLIHGGQMDSRMWDEQFALFSKRYRVIRYDVRGFGKSPRATEVYASEKDLYKLLKFLDVEKAVLVGLSLGGRISIDFALLHPEMLAGMVAAAPGLSGFQFSSDPTEWPTIRAAQTGDWKKVADLWLKSGYMAPAMENPKIAPRLRELATENAHEDLDNPILETMPDPPAIERLPDVRVPTLILVGNRDVTDIHEICGLLFARIPGAKQILIQGSGHILNMEQPAQFNRAVLDFLGEVAR
jgi:3-oxoadipate enol-lactonase